MIYGSVCSGIEAATVAWEPLGWRPEFFSEIEKFPSAVLAHHYPDVPNLGDMTKYKEWTHGAIDILVGGTPCQSFSVAGLRKGMADPRGNLALVFLGIVDHARPRWVVWENVPGVLSSNEGRDFGAFLGALGELGYGFAYRVLDAQYFGVPQRRRRVFVVGYLGDWRPAAAVLFERHSMQGHPAPCREKGEKPAPTISARTKGGGGLGTDFDCDGGLVAAPVCGNGYGDQVSRETHLVAHSASEDGARSDTPLVTCFENHGQDSRIKDCGDLAPQINAQAVCYGENGIDGGYQGDIIRGDGDIWGCLPAQGGNNGGGSGGILHSKNSTVRRLTPRECERLQGFPDDYTRIPWRGKPANDCPDGPRYKALGNSMAVPVMRWIGERIQMVEEIINKKEDL